MLNQFGLVTGNSYRIAAKPKLTTCNSPQEGDYGPFCVVTIGAAMAPNDPSSMEVMNEEIHVERNAADIMEVDEQGNVAVISFQGIQEKMATIHITDDRALGKGMIQLVGMNGQMLFSNDVFIESMDQLIQVPLPSNIASGLYMVSFRTQEHTVTEKFWVR
jgi:hydrogenase maturation factor